MERLLNSLKKTIGAIIFVAISASGVVCAQTPAPVPYSTDFESGIGAEWSSTNRNVAYPATFTAFTGRFGNDSQTLSLSGLVDGTKYTVSFDLYIIDTWDGGSDQFVVEANGGEVFRYSFANYNSDSAQANQSYPYKPDVGRFDMGFSAGYVDAIYRKIEVTFTNVGTTATIRFHGDNLQTLDDESWGLDNVQVKKTSDLPITAFVGGTIPAPGTTGTLAMDSFSILASRALQTTPASDATNYKLIEAGANGTFGDADDVTIAITPTFNGAKTVTFALATAPLQPGKYRFTALNLVDVNGTAVTSYTNIFNVGNPVLGKIESASNDTLPEATLLNIAESPATSGLFTGIGEGVFQPSNDSDFWRFDAESGDRISIFLKADSLNIYPDISLRNAANQELTHTYGGYDGYALLQNYTISAPGAYYIQVYSRNNVGSRYNFRVDQSRRPQLEVEDNGSIANANDLTLQVSAGSYQARVAGAITPTDAGDYYRLGTLNVGNAINVSLAFPDGSDLTAGTTTVSVFVEGTTDPVATSTSGTVSYTVAADGIHYIKVESTTQTTRAQYLMTVTATDGVGPVVKSLTFPDEGTNTTDILTGFTVNFSEPVDGGFSRITSFQYYNGHAYSITDSSETWAAAEAEAILKGGHLVTINDAAENSWVNSHFSSYGNLWIGFTDQASEGNYVWISGDSSTFTAWNNGEPNNSGGAENWAQMNTSGGWNDNSAGATSRGVLEVSGTDTDGDGIPNVSDPYPTDPTNGFELRSAGTDGVFGSSDDRVYHVSSLGYSGGLSASFAITDGPLQPGKYRLTISTAIKDRAGNPIATAYVRNFTVTPLAGWVLENTSNDSPATATSLSTNVSVAADGSFSPFTSMGAGSNPWSMAVGKFNGDNHLDIAVGNRSSGNVTVYIGKGDGTFNDPVSYAVQGGPISMTSGDFNGDSKLDLVVANYDNSSASILLGNGDGTFKPATNFNGSLSNPRGIASGDLNGDGKLDLVFGNNSSSITVMLGNGDGTFGTPATFTAESGAWSVALGDLNGDGKLDVVVGNQNTSDISVMMGNGDGTFGAAVPYAVGDNPRSVAVGDLNGDGKLDIATINYSGNNNTFSVLLNNGSGVFGAATNFSSGTSDSYCIVMADVTGDGKKDLVAAGQGNATVAIAPGNGDGTFGNIVSYGVGNNPMSVRFGDFNEDGRLDFATANYGSANVGIYLGNRVQTLSEDPVGSGLRSGQGRGSLLNQGDADYWSFSGNAGDRVVVAVDVPGNPGATQLYFRIEDSSGRDIRTFYPTYNGWGQSAPVELPATGTYFVLVTYNYQYYGEYRLRVSLVPKPTQIETEDNSQISQANYPSLSLAGHTLTAKVLGYISVGDQNGDYFALGNLGKGAKIDLTLQETARDPFEDTITILDPSGAPVFTSAANATTGTFTVPTGNEGTYYARVTANFSPTIPTNTPGLFAQYLLGMSVTDSTAPTITSVSLPAQNSTNILVPPTFTIGFNEDMTASTVLTNINYELRSAGADGVLNTSDDQLYTVVCKGYTSGLSAGYAITDGPLQPGKYRFRIKTGLMDYAGNALAQEYVSDFVVVSVPGFVFEDRDNNTPATATLLSATIGAGSDGSFLPVASYPAGSNPWSIVTGKFNNDTNLDVAIGNRNGSVVTVFLGNGDGTFQTGTNYSVQGGPISMVSGDFNKDGNLDLVVGNYDNSSFSLLLGNGNGTFQTATNFTGGFSNPRGVAAADFNGDGKLDLVFGNNGGTTVNVFLGNGDGTFGANTNFTAGTNPWTVQVADVDGNGRLDLVTANMGTDDVTVLLGNGDGSFGAPTSYPIGQNPRSLSLGDLNGDGKVDIATIGDNNVISILLNNGNGTFGTPTQFAAGTSDPYDIEIVDVNGDGKKDLAFAGVGNGGLFVALGNGDGTFQGIVGYSVSGSPMNFAVADVNGDGRLDFVTANYYGGTLGVVLGNGPKTLTEDPVGSGFRTVFGRGNLDTSSDVDFWSFSAKAGDVVTIAVDIPGNPGASQLYYELRRSDGNSTIVTWYPDYTGWGQSPPATVPADGTYFFRVAANYGYTGEYRFRITLAPAGTQLEAEPNNNTSQSTAVSLVTTNGHQVKKLLGYLSVGDAVGDYYSLGNLSGATTLSMNMSQPTTSGLAAIVDVINSVGTVVASSNPGAATFTYNIPDGADGAYYLRVTSAGPSRPGDAGPFLSFDGGNAHVDTGAWSAGAQWTVQAWVRPSGLPGGRKGIAGSWSSCQDWGLAMVDGQLSATIKPPGQCSAALGSGVFATVDTWYHLTATSDGTTAKVYVNGVLMASAPVDAAWVPTTAGVWIGGEVCCGDYFPGLIDDVRIWRRVLADDEITASLSNTLSGAETGLAGYWKFDEHTGTVIADLSGESHNGTVSGNATWVKTGATTAKGLGIASQYILNVDLADTVPPSVTGVTLPTEGSSSAWVDTRFNATFSKDMSAATVNASTNYDLRTSGADGLFGTADDQIYTVAPGTYTTGLTASYSVPDGPLQPGNYRFTVKTGIQARSGTPLTSPFVRNFTVTALPGFFLEPRTNDSFATAGSLSVNLSSNPDGSFFVTGAPSAVGSNPYSIALADFNGDGKLDAVTADLGSSQISLLLGNGNGTFQNAVPFPVGQSQPIALVVGDFDKDGHPDVAVANHGTTTVSIFLGTGSGFQTPVTYQVGSSPRGIAMGDFNGDGILDLAVSNESSGNMSVLIGHGDGTFADRVNYGSDSGAFGIAVGDFNKDGKMDIAVSNAGANNVTIFTGVGDGTFSATATFDYGVNATPRGMTAVDLNGDGRVDLVTVCAGISQVFVQLAKLDGTLAAPIAYASGPSGAYGIAAADVTGDGKLDVISANYGNSRVGILQGFGNGTLSTAMNYSVGGNPIAVAAGDLDGDGIREIVTANYSSASVSVLKAHTSQPLIAEDPLGSGVRTVAGHGQIFNSTDSDYWSFSADAGDSVTVAFDVPGNPAASGLLYRLYEPDGDYIFDVGADYSGWGQSTAVIPASGTYYLQIRQNYQYYGEYKFRVTLARKPLQMESENNNSRPNADQLTFAATNGKRTATVVGFENQGDANNAGDYFGLGNLADGATVHLAITKPSNSPYTGNIVIQKSDGTAVATASSTNGVLDYTVPTGAAGAYYAQVTGDNASLGLFSQYILTIQLGDSTTPAIVSVTLPSEGSTNVTVFDRFAVGFNKDMDATTVNVGANYDLRAAGADGLFGTPDDQTYTVAPGTYTAGLSVSLSITDGPLQPGSYRLTIAGLRDLFGNAIAPYTRSFSISVLNGFTIEDRDNNSAATATPLVFVDLQTGLKTAGGRGNLTSTSDLDFWSFNGHAGDHVTIAVENPGSPGSTQLYYRVDKPDGTMLFDFYSDGNGSGEFDDTTLPVDGTYVLRVRYNNNYQGEYNLRVTIDASAVQLEREGDDSVATATALTFTQNANARNASGAGYIRTGTDLDYYNLGTLTNGSTVFLAVRIPAGSNLDPVVGVYSAANGYVAEVNSGRPTDGVAEVQITQTGTYYAVVRGNNGSSGLFAHYILDTQVVPTGSVSFPNLQVSSITPPSGTISSGGSVGITFKVSNVGSSATAASTWTDRVVLSSNTTLGDADDVTLGIVTRTGALAGGANYTANLNARLPDGISGQFYIIVQTDFGNDVNEFVLEGDNSAASTAFAVTLAPYADLKVENLAVTAGTGNDYNIAWNTANRGTRNVTTAFKERVIVRNTATGITLLNNERDVTNTVNVGATIPQTATVTVTSFGTFQVLVTTDSRDVIFEFDATSHASAELNTFQTTFDVHQNLAVTVAANPAGAGTVGGGGTFSSGSTVTVTATPITTTLPYQFLNWTENGLFQSSSASYAFTLNAPRQLVANFVLPTFTVGATAAPTIGGSISGKGTYSYGNTAVLTAIPSAGYKFVNWTESNTVVSVSASITNIITANHSYVANFAEANTQHIVTTATSPTGVTTIAGAGTYTNGASFQYTAPNRITNSPNIYTFQEFRVNGATVTALPTYTKSFSTLDPTNVQVTAIYQAQSIAPVIVQVIRNFADPAPATTNFLLSVQFDRSMDSSVIPSLTITNPVTHNKITFPNTGVWTAGSRPNDTYSAPAVALTAAVAGTNTLLVSGAKDTLGTVMTASSDNTVVVDATAPPAPVISLVSSNATSATFGWSGYSAPADLASFRIYLQRTNFTSLTGITPLDGVAGTNRSYTLTGLQLDTNYFLAVVALDAAGNASTFTATGFNLGSTVPPAVAIVATPSGPDSVTISWNSYNTAALVGFTGFNLYYQNTPFTTVAGLTPKQALDATNKSVTINSLDRSKTYYFAVVGVNRLGQFTPAVTTAQWSDPYAGTISANLTIGGGTASTIDIFSPITVANHAVLTVTPGTTLRFAAGAGITVQSGQLIAEGTALDPIVFTSSNDQPGLTPAAGDWNGVTLSDATVVSRLRQVFVKYGKGLTVTAGAPTLTALTTLYNKSAGVSLLNAVALETSDALIAYNDVGVYQSGTAKLVIHDSILKGNNTNAWANGSASLIATQNWWGTAIASDIATQVVGTVTITANLGTEPLLTPAIAIAGGLTQTSSRIINLRLACRSAESYRLSEDSAFTGAFFTPITNASSFQLSDGGGQKTVYVQYRSVTGNTSAPLPVTINYVTGGPVIATFNLSEGLVLNRPFTVTASATAPVGMGAMELYLDGQPIGTNQGAALSLLLDVRNFSDSTHRARLVARDISGSIAVSELNVVIAKLPPPAPVITSPVDGTIVNTSSFNIAGTAEPNGSVQITRNGAVLATVTANATGNFTATGLSLVEGRNRLVASGVDTVGSTPSAAVNISLDTVAPVKLILDTPTYSPATGLAFTWHFSPTGKQATKYELFWSLSPFTSINQATGRSLAQTRQAYAVYGLANGHWYFGVVGYDDLGNTSPLSDLVAYDFDGKPPVFTLHFDKPSPVGVGPLNLTLTSDEALAATPSLTMTAVGAAPVLVHLTGTAVNTYEATLTIGRTTGNGPISFNVSGQDLAGNNFNGAPGGPAVVIDTQPPVASIITVPVGPVQTTNSTNVNITLRTTEAIATGTSPTLTFKPPVGDAVAVTLTGSGTNWTGVLALAPEMGSGFGQFNYSGADAVGNTGTDISSGGSLEIYNTPLPSSPNAPLHPKALAIANGQIRLTWDIVTNAEIYRVYRDPGTNLLAPSALVVDNLTTNSTVDLPPADGPYHYAITASRRGAESFMSDIVVVTSDRVAPPAPTSVAAQLAISGVSVSWTETGAETPDHFNIYRNNTLINSIKTGSAITDYPPRGLATYTIGAVDVAGNEALSAPASISLLVSGVNNLTALAASGQALALTWTSDDSTAIGFNVYRNALKQNNAPIAQPNYVDPLNIGTEPVTYSVTAQNAKGEESAPRTFVIYPTRLSLIANSANDTSGSLTTRYFDEFRVRASNLGATNPIPLARFEIRRTADGADTVNLTRSLNVSVAPGQTLEQKFEVPEPLTPAAETVRVRAIQQGDVTVIYQNSFDFSDVSSSSQMVDVSANQQPLAGGLATLSVQVFNRGYANLDFITATENGAKPGDVYVSVKNPQGQEVGRTLFTGTPKGTFFLNDGRAFVRIPGGGSIKFDVPNILVADALGTNQATFEAVVSKTYNGLGSPDQVQGSDLRGSMVSSLAQTPYYGTAQTAKTGYADEEPIIITGQAIDRQTGQPVPNAALKIGFSARGFRWSRDITTDATGNYSYEYTPTPGFAGNLNIWAAHPLVFDQLNQVAVTYYRLYPQPFASDIRMSKNDNLDFTISLVNPGDVPLTGFTLEFDAYQIVGTNHVPLTNVTGTASIDTNFVVGAGRTVPINMSVHAAADAPDNAVVEYTLRSAEGGSAKFVGAVTLLPAIPVLSMVTPAVGYLEVSVNRGDLRSSQITIQNKGLKDLKGVTLSPPSTNKWMQVNLPASDDGQIHLPDLIVGQSLTFAVAFTPPADTALDYYSDQIVIRGTNATANFAFNVYALVTSNEKGSVQFFVDDILGEPVANATIRMRSGLLQMELPTATTDSAGLVTINEIPEGDWSWQALAPGHSGTVSSVHVTPDQTIQVHTRLSKSLVTIDFTVVPVPYTDKYEIKLEQTFETHVPAPVIVLDPAFKDFKNVSPGFEANFIVTVKNFGLIQLTDVTIKGSQVSGGVLTPLIEYFPLLLPQQSVEVPFVFTYNTPGASQQGQRRQISGGDIANCLVGAFPFGALADPAILQGLAAIFAGGFQCVTDLTPQQAAATLAAVFAIGQIAAAWGSAAEFLVGFVGGALACIIGNLLPAFDGGGGGVSPGRGDGAYNVANVACFEAGTRILLEDGRSRPIEQVTTNDVVRVGPRSTDIAPVSATYKRPAETLREIEWEGGWRIHATREHQFWVDGKGWVAAANLQPGDHLMNNNGGRMRITRIADIANKQPVYTFSVRGDNAFYANGVLVHDMCANEGNKTASAVTGGGRDAQ